MAMDHKWQNTKCAVPTLFRSGDVLTVESNYDKKKHSLHDHEGIYLKNVRF